MVSLAQSWQNYVPTAPRQFTDLVEDVDQQPRDIGLALSGTRNPSNAEDVDNEKRQLLNFIENDVIGSDAIIQTVFGGRQILYADYTASGRALRVFEDYIRSELLPLYANTHTTASATGTQSTLFRAEARDIILRCVGGERTTDAVLFTGTGCTGAVAKLVHILTRTDEWQQCLTSGQQPLILIGPYEHHSNILPWRESGARVIPVREAAAGGVDMAHLEELLDSHAAVPFKARRPLSARPRPLQRASAEQTAFSRMHP